MRPATAPLVPHIQMAGRLGWLDLLRGIAALVVALHHGSYYFTPELREWLLPGWFDPGRYGVLVFFVVSGYIIPASLERHGQIRAFWIGRAARIYPLLAVACAVTVAPFLLGIRHLRAGLEQQDPLVAVVSHLTMLQDLLAVPNAVNVLWSLSYEMLFYLLVVGLFSIGGHRRSAPIAMTLAAAAVLIGGVLPTMMLSKAIGTGPVVTTTALALVAAITMSCSGRAALRLAGGIAGGVVAIVLVTLNGRIGPWESLATLALMFAGTALYRAENGQIGRRTAALSITFVVTCAVAAGIWHARESMPPVQAAEFQVYWTGSVLLAVATITMGWVLRRRRIPAWLTGLGTISFSLYLLHPLLLMLYDQFIGTPEHDMPVRLALFLAALIAISRLTHRYIEAPCQRLGRRLTRTPRQPAEHPDPLPAPAS